MKCETIKKSPVVKTLKPVSKKRLVKDNQKRCRLTLMLKRTKGVMGRVKSLHRKRQQSGLLGPRRKDFTR